MNAKGKGYGFHNGGGAKAVSNKLLTPVMLVILSVVIVAGCSKKDDKSIKDENPFEETDKIAMEFYKAGFELNIPKVYEMLSPKGREELEKGEYQTGILKEDNTPLFVNTIIEDNHYKKYKDKYFSEFKEFEKLHEEYEVRRYDSVYNEEIGEIVYYVAPWSEYDMSDSDFNFISIKQNNDGEWKVKAFKEGIPDQIDDWETGTIIHQFKKNEDIEEDDYGFGNDED